MKIIKNEYYITDKPSKVNVNLVIKMLSKTYWAKNRSSDIIKKSIQNSICFSLYKKEVQIGFGRIVTDHATFGFLADVIIDEKFRGKGLGKWFVDTIVRDQRWNKLFLILATKDAHSLYEKYGFKKDEILMGKK